LFKHRAQGETFEDFVNNLQVQYEASTRRVEDTQSYTGVGSIVQLPIGCDSGPKVTVNDIQEAVDHLADCLQHESWLKEELSQSCEDVADSI
jgi:hypothetical protein